MKSLFSTITPIIIVPLLTGCNLKDLDLGEQGALTGAAVGGTGGYLICRMKGNDPDECRRSAFVGAATGAIAGGLYGKSIEQRRDAYASDEEFYTAQIEELQTINSQLRKERDTIDEQIASARADLDRIVNELSTTQEKQARAQKIRSRVDNEKDQLDDRIAEYKSELQTNEQILAESRQNDSEDSDRLAAEIARLQDEIAALDGKSDELAAISSVAI